MKEYRQIIDVPVVALDRAALLQLEEILKEDTCYQIDNKNYFDITLGIENHSISAKSFDELLNDGISGISNELRIEVTGWTEERNIDKTVHLTMYHNFIQYQISSTSESWFLGKIEQLNKFFEINKPWYAKLKSVLPVLMGFIFPVSGLLTVPAFYFEKYYLLIFPFLLWVVSEKIWKLSLEQKLFPYVKIDLNPVTKKQASYEKASIVIAALTLIVSVVGSILIPLLIDK